MDKQSEIATILAYGDVHGDAAAATQFKLSLRSVQRYRKQVKDGTNPELTRAVVEKSKHVSAKYGELMDEVLELSLHSLRARVLTAVNNKTPIEDRALIGAIKILSEQRVTREFLHQDNDELSASDDQSSTEAAGPAAEAQGSQTLSTAAVH